MAIQTSNEREVIREEFQTTKLFHGHLRVKRKKSQEKENTNKRSSLLKMT